jgi:hypothetical protein
VIKGIFWAWQGICFVVGFNLMMPNQLLCLSGMDKREEHIEKEKGTEEDERKCQRKVKRTLASF